MDPNEIDSPVSTIDEKDLEKGGSESELERERSTHIEPIRSTPRLPASARPGSLHSIHSHRSFGGEDGYSYFRDDEDGDDGLPAGYEEPKETEEEKEFEVKWDGESDPMNPRCKKKWNKWLIVVIIAFCSLCVTCTSSLYTLTYEQLEREFHTTREMSTLGLSTYVFGLGFGPMVLSPLSEFYGRRPIYMWSYLMFVIWIIPCAVAPNIATMLVARFFNGLSGSAFLSVAGGTVGDMFARHELSMPMMAYTASPFLGPAIGPLIGGFINQYASWRWSFYVLLIWAGVLLTLIILFVPETYHPVILRHKAIKLRKETGEPRWQAPIEKLDRSVARTVMWSCIRPFQLLLLEPMCLNLCLLSAILLGILYLFFGAFPLVFGVNHGFTLSQIGLTFLGIFVGQILAIICDPLWRRFYTRLVRNNQGVNEPEFRLPPTVLGAWIVPIGLFGFAWTTYSSVHWIVPIIFSAIFGFGNIFVFAGVFTFLVECYPLYAASALAANSFARSSFAAAFPLFGVQMYDKLGYQWAGSLLAFLSLAMAPFPYLFFRYGKQLRGKSRFAS